MGLELKVGKRYKPKEIGRSLKYLGSVLLSSDVEDENSSFLRKGIILNAIIKVDEKFYIVRAVENGDLLVLHHYNDESLIKRLLKG
ncbi:MAG: hypothetical protein KatS3mg001_604 [Candidatus Pacearchaeota archaeon]|nr:MAG: hypothetical protein KatS3mg001_604 [Candidatus Pacearchaeota archaeon]